MADLLNLNKNAPMLDLHKASPALRNLKASMNWAPHPVHGASLTEGFDLDFFAFALKDNKISDGGDVCFFNNKHILNDSISVPVDNRTGSDEEDEYLLMKLDQIPADKNAVDIYVFVYEADKRGHHLGMMVDAKFVLENLDTKEVIQTYGLSQFVDSTVVHIGRMARTPDGWSFQPVGEAAKADANAVASAYM